MHRTKVKVVEEALDANNTIAQANRADFDRAGRQDQPERRGNMKVVKIFLGDISLYSLL